jgi:DNA/RNA-binding domain of Phe-tRNA-synthetase-like protein
MIVDQEAERQHMYFQHSEQMWQQFPDLVAGVMFAEGIRRDVDVEQRLAPYNTRATERLEHSTEGELPEIQAWRRTFSKMGLKPTQYRCASESLLRRFRKERTLPRIHPLIDLCNAVSIAFAIPVAVFDVAHVQEYIEVRHANGDERYLTFSGENETPPAGEVIFADAAGQAHARRWTNRQSGLSAIRDDTTTLLIVAEAMHESALDDVSRLVETLEGEIRTIWATSPMTALLSQSAPRFEFG